MGLNFPHLGIENEFDWKRFGYGGQDGQDPTRPYHNQCSMQTYYTVCGTTLERGYKNFSYNNSNGSMTLGIAPSDFTYNGSAATLKNYLRKGIYQIEGHADIAMPGNGLTSKAYNPSNTYEGYEYGVSLNLKLLHDIPYYYDSDPTSANYVDMLGRSGFSKSQYQYIAVKDNEIIPHPDMTMNFKSDLLMIDPEHILEGLRGSLTYDFARSLQEYNADATISANAQLYVEWHLIYDMSDDVPNKFNRQFWKENDD